LSVEPVTDTGARCVICDALDLEEVRPAEIDGLDDVSFSYSFSPQHSKTFRVVRCRACTHQFCAPLPGRVAERYHDVVDDEYLKHAASRRLAARGVFETIGRHAAPWRLLDVGCATGDFLEAGRAAGWAVEGLELSDWSCAIARQRGLTVHQKTLARFADERVEPFDVVTLIGVIEHLPAPRAEMANLARLVRPGGLLVVWTGDVDSWLARLLGRRWWYWQGQHIQYFTHRSLALLAGAAGFATVATERYPFAMTHETLANSLRRYPMHRVMSAALAPVFLVAPVITLRLPGEMLFVARRTAP
jgi:SAM-dependent methyltransferase